MKTLRNTISVRKGEELNSINLEKFLREHVEELPHGELQIEQFSSGHSNLTYLLKINNWEAVLRRPPLGPVASKAHDMVREFNILSELHPIFPIAPKPYLYSSENEIIGSPFFLMERKSGVVLDTELPSHIHVTKDLLRGISEKMVDALVHLHNIDYKQTKLLEWSKPDGFMKRQVHGWIERYERVKTEDIVDIDSLENWLVTHIPLSQSPSIIHYDFKLNNAMFSHDLSEIVGLFDWEMTTVGDPLADLGAAMSYWIQVDDPEGLQKGMGKPPITVNEGFLRRKEFIELYAQKSGRDVSNINYYVTFAYFKLAVICQQIYYRYKKGQTNDERFKNFHYTVKWLIKQAIFSLNIKI
jgi:aminoglycoside phosphotransferase (APT) family kinase protein